MEIKLVAEWLAVRSVDRAVSWPKSRKYKNRGVNHVCWKRAIIEGADLTFSDVSHINYHDRRTSRPPRTPRTRSRPDTRVITVADLDGGIRDVFPEELAVQATRAGEEAISALSGETAASPPAGDESAVEHVRVCVRRLQGTRTLLRKTFRVPPGILLFTVFAKACEKLHVNEDGVVFVHDGAILSGWRKAGTLSCGAAAVHRAVQVFVVCKRAWACKQRAAARRGLVSISTCCL